MHFISAFELPSISIQNENCERSKMIYTQEKSERRITYVPDYTDIRQKKFIRVK